MSKHAYEKGVVLIKCETCANVHLIADHLGWFDSQKGPLGTIENIMKEKGESVEKVAFESDKQVNDYLNHTATISHSAADTAHSTTDGLTQDTLAADTANSTTSGLTQDTLAAGMTSKPPTDAKVAGTLAENASQIDENVNGIYQFVSKSIKS